MRGSQNRLVCWKEVKESEGENQKQPRVVARVNCAPGKDRPERVKKDVGGSASHNRAWAQKVPISRMKIMIIIIATRDSLFFAVYDGRAAPPGRARQTGQENASCNLMVQERQCVYAS